MPARSRVNLGPKRAVCVELEIRNACPLTGDAVLHSLRVCLPASFLGLLGFKEPLGNWLPLVVER